MWIKDLQCNKQGEMQLQGELCLGLTLLVYHVDDRGNWQNELARSLNIHQFVSKLIQNSQI